MSGEAGNQSGQTMTANNQQVVTTSTTSGQMTVSSQVVQQQQQSQPSPGQQQQQQQQQQAVPQQQQLQLQQATATLHSHQQQNQGGNPMQQLQLIQQPMQNPYNLQQLYNTQGQLLMSGNTILHHGLNSINPQIQVIAAAKSFSSNQLTSPHMLTAATSYTIPTSAPNNQQSYIIGPLLNSQASLLQHQQGSKPGEIQKIISPQIGTQLQQGLWASPHNFLAQNIIFRGGQPEQQQMYIQPQQHQHFSMPMTATANQLPTTSISPITSTTVQQSAQQSPPTVQHTHQQHQNQTQHSIQPQQANVISVKTPITLQPKPQIQPQPSPQQQQQQQQQQQMQQHIQQVTMHQSTQQIQMIPQTPTSLPQSISITQQPASQTLTTTHVVQQQTQQQQPRQLTILPQQTQIQTQPVQIVQTAQQPQPIRPNPNYTTTTVNVASTVQAQMTPPNAGQRPNKIRKPAVARGSTTGSPPQQTKQVFPRMPPNQNNSGIVPQQPRQIQPSQGGVTLQPLTRIPIANQTATTQQQQQQILGQPLKTINMAALQPNLPDATLTPLTPQSNPLQSATSHQQQQQSVPQQLQQVFQQTNATQLPSPNISITPTNSLPIGIHPHQRKEENLTERAETKADTEKENNKSNNSMEDQDDSLGKQKLPKAMVKPQVLTHVIEGFVIQEAAEPFPMPTMDSDEPPKKKVALGAEKAKCELCGIIDLKAKFKKNKRFCSSACAKGMKTVHQKHQQQQAQIGGKPNLNNTNSITNDRTPQGKGRKWGEGVDGDLTDETNSSMGDVSTLSPNEEQIMEDDVKVNPMKWDVAEVVDFVKSLPGCSEYANDFAEHEIDGQALLLLKEDHLMSAMNMKLGPALKLCAKIEYIRSNSAGESART